MPQNLMGLSYEKTKIFRNMFTTANTTLIGCFQRLGPGILHIGGYTDDTTTWVPNGAGATNNQVAPPDIRNLAGFLQATGWSVIYGMNFAKNTAALAAQEAKFVSDTLGASLIGFELGDECELYSSSDNGLEPPSYDLNDFISDWSSFATAIRQSVPNAGMTGPAAVQDIQQWVVPFVNAVAPKSLGLDLLTFHYYRGSGTDPSATMQLLLTPKAYLPEELQTLGSAAKSAGLSGGIRYTETNSYYNQGAPNVSNAFGSALWGVDYMMIHAQGGSAGVNFHGGGTAAYSPLADNDTSVVEVRPLYYSLLFVTQIPQGPMYAVTLTTQLNLTAYGIAGNDGATYVVIVNKEEAYVANVTIDLPTTARQVTQQVLIGGGINATAAGTTTFNGATVSNNGSWKPAAPPTKTVKSATMQLSVPAACAVLLKFTT